MLEVFAAGDALGTGFTLTKDSTVMDLLARGATRLESLQSAPLVRAELAHSMGQVYWGYSEYGEAEALFELALGLRQTHLGASNDTAESLLMLGRVYERTGRFAEMLGAMQGAHAMRMQVIGPEHPDTVHALHRIAASYYQLQELDRAADIAQTAIESWREHLPERALDKANSHTIRSLSLLRMGQFAEALQHMNEVIALRLAVLPADHNQVGEGYTNRARIHFAQGGVEQALADARRALAISEAQYPGDHWSLVQDYEKLAQYLVADSDLTAAAEIADKGVAMAQRLHQRTPNPEVVDVALHARIVVLRAQGFYPQALALARQVVQSRATRIAPSNTNLLDTRALLADLLRLSGEAEQAQTELMLAVDGWRQRPASHAPQLVATMGLFATAGYCDWLQTTWPEQMAAPMAAALAHGRQTCHMSGAAFGSE
jgi:tetratricopeptide (TPR) repeat protein